MNDEKERAEFEAWWGSTPILKESKRTIAEKAYQAGRAALQSQDRGDADQWFEKLRILITDFGIACADYGAVEMYMMPNIFDHARRIDGEGE